jgi:hypothetical protein
MVAFQIFSSNFHLVMVRLTEMAIVKSANSTFGIFYRSSTPGLLELLAKLIDLLKCNDR